MLWNTKAGNKNFDLENKNNPIFRLPNILVMPSTIAQKLKVKEGFTLLTIHAPAEFKNDLSNVSNSITISDKTKTYDQIHWFVKNKAQMEGEVSMVIDL